MLIGGQDVAHVADEYGDDILTDDELDYLDSQQPDLPDPYETHYANLAEYMDDDELNIIAQKILEWKDVDEESRKDWQERERKGILLLGVSENTEGGASFDGACKVVHPLLAEACVQFQARAMEATWPADGPVKTIIVGDKDDEAAKQSERVQQYMNYQYTQQMPGAYEEQDRMLLRLPLSGSAFKKAYYDPLEGTVVTKFVNGQDFLVPYEATSLRTASRHTHIERMAQNDVRKLQKSGFFVDVDLGLPVISGDGENQETIDEIDATEGKSQDFHEDDQQHTLYECHCYYDLQGFEDVDECDCETGIALPYVITVEKDSMRVLSIRRNWREGDAMRKKRVHFTHYRFLPGFGFYGYGFLHIIGGLSRAATGALRALLDAAQFNNLPGGFKDKDAKIPNGDVAIAPGEWRDVEASADELSKAFFRLPYEEPSRALFQLLGYLDDIGRRFAGTTESVIGDANNTGPVGTTLALIEQGLKVFSGIHKRLHIASGEEYKLVAELNFEWLPEEGYPYQLKEVSAEVFYQDFDGRVDVIPVGDPNIVTSTQRIAQAQSVLQLAERAPHLYDVRVAHRRMLESLRIQNIDEVLPEPKSAVRLGPVEEMQAIISGKPVKAYLDQNHEAHIAVHRMAMQMLPPDMAKMVGPSFMAHIQEHIALAFTLQMQQATGINFMILNDDEEEEVADLPPQIEYKIAAAAGQAAAQMMPQPLPSPEELDAQRKNALTEADINRKDVASQADIDRKDAEALADAERKNEKQEQDLLDRFGL